MFLIDPAPFEIALAQAQAQLAQEQARNDQARRDAARLKPLAEQKAVSRKEYDDATSSLKLSDATLQAAQANVQPGRTQPLLYRRHRAGLRRQRARRRVPKAAWFRRVRTAC